MNKEKQLVVIQKIEQKLREPIKKIIFPIGVEHRKELRRLRDSVVGDIKTRIQDIKTLKQEEYFKKNKGIIIKGLEGKWKVYTQMNKEWEDMKEKIRNMLVKRQEKEDKVISVGIGISCSYDSLSKLDMSGYDKTHRKISMDKEKESRNISNSEFDKKYGKPFLEIQDILTDMKTKFEEAINFGDLEMVKKLYYAMKDSEVLFQKISDMKV